MGERQVWKKSKQLADGESWGTWGGSACPSSHQPQHRRQGTVLSQNLGDFWQPCPCCARCPGSAGFSHTMEQSARASPRAMANTELLHPLALWGNPKTQSKLAQLHVRRGQQAVSKDRHEHSGLQTALLGCSEPGAPQSDAHRAPVTHPKGTVWLVTARPLPSPGVAGRAPSPTQQGRDSQPRSPHVPQATTSCPQRPPARSSWKRRCPQRVSKKGGSTRAEMGLISCLTPNAAQGGGAEGQKQRGVINNPLFPPSPGGGGAGGAWSTAAALQPAHLVGFESREAHVVGADPAVGGRAG